MVSEMCSTDMYRRSPNDNSISEKKSLDEFAILTYKGRRIEIISNGNGERTEIYIDGKKISHVSDIRIHITPRGENEVKITVLDF